LTLRPRLPASLALALLLAPAAPAAASDVTTQPLSSNATEDGDPQVAAGRVAWRRGAEGASDSEIVLFEGSGSTQVSSNSVRDYEPRLSDTFLIWKRTTDGSSCRLDVFDFDASDFLDTSFPCEEDIAVAGPHVGWVDGTLLDDDAKVSTELASPEVLGDNDDEDRIRVGDVSGSPRAVWVDDTDNDLFYWNGSDAPDVIAPAPPAAVREQTRMDGRRAVWVDDVGGDFEIFLYTGTTVVQLTNNDYDDVEPDIAGDHVVWRGFPEDPAEGEIFHYDGTASERVTDDDLGDEEPHVSMGPDGPTIAWVKQDGDDEVWMFDGCESTQLTDNSVDDDDIDLDGSLVAWVRGSGSAAEIHAATVLCDVACGNGEVEPGEECDDGDTLSGDGCSDVCLEEICGNARVDAGEECDDGNTLDDDDCDSLCQLECGNGNLDGDEQCDDGNRTNGDLCDENCIDEVCGNGVVQPGPPKEDCDDGNTLSGDGCSSSCVAEAPASEAHQRCIQKLNERGAAVAKAQHQVNAKCLEDAAKGNTAGLGVPATAQDCLGNDPRGKAAKAQDKTVSGDAKQCSPANLPGFAYQGPAAVNAAGEAEPIALMADLFGANLDLAVIAKAVDPQGARCQREVTKAANAVADRIFKLAIKEKKALLAGKEDGSLAISNEALQTQLFAFLEADADGKIARKESELRTAAQQKCGGVALAAAFPGCAPSSIGALGDCAIAAARCRFCRAFDAFDGLAADCDGFDDAAANASCP
jgi:cysteine-rich repeat protein